MSAAHADSLKKKGKEIDWTVRSANLSHFATVIAAGMERTTVLFRAAVEKDSIYVSHVLKHKYGMNPLTVTWAPHKYTDTGWRNFQAWIRSGFDNILFSPNGDVHAKLTRLAFLNLCHPFQPFIVGQRITGPRASALFGIPLVFYGENQAEYGNNIVENDRPIMAPEFFSHEPSLEKLHLAGTSAAQLVSEHGFSPRDLNFYLPPAPEHLRAAGTVVHYLSYYLKWDPQQNFYYAVENTKFETFPERIEGSYSKYSSFDDVIDWLHWYTTFVKFGIGRTTYDAAQEIRTGKITREEGVALVRRYDGEPPRRYLREILDYLELDEKVFWEVIDRPGRRIFGARSVTIGCCDTK